MKATKPFTTEEEYWDYIARVKERKLHPPPPKKPKSPLLPDDDYGAKFLPSQEQIAVACEEIQASWGPIERRRRLRNSGLIGTPVTVMQSKVFTNSRSISDH